MSLAVTAPPTLTGQLAARLLSSGRVELAFRPTGGVRILPTSRFATPSSVSLTRWTTSSEVRGAAGGEENRLLGKIMVKRVQSGSRFYLDICFVPAGSSRTCPSSNNFYYCSETVDRWLDTGSFSFQPLRAADGIQGAAGSNASSDDQMLPASAGEATSDGFDGGLVDSQGLLTTHRHSHLTR